MLMFDEKTKVFIIYIDLEEFVPLTNKNLLFVLSKVGIRVTPLKWFSNSLTERYSNVKVATSDLRILQLTAAYLKEHS